MPTLIHQRVEEARAGKNAMVIARVPSGWVVLGDNQFLSGYSLLLPDPVVPTLNDLTGAARAQFWEDLGILGDAVLSVTHGIRINYEILGNLEPALHAHVFPRFSREPENLKTRPVWFYDRNPDDDFDLAKHKSIMTKIARELAALYEKRGVDIKTFSNLAE